MESRNLLGRELSKKNDELFKFSAIKEKESNELLDKYKTKLSKTEYSYEEIKNNLLY